MSMKPIMIVPAAGRGTRLGGGAPKPLTLVNRRPMIDIILDLYGDYVERFVLVIDPVSGHSIESHCKGRSECIEFAYQDTPTGMLDAILIPRDRLRVLSPECVWITWCDQIAISPETVVRLSHFEERPQGPAVVLPTTIGRTPYIHLERNEAGEITQVLHRREGDSMPDTGQCDMGLFRLSAQAYFDLLPRFAASTEPSRRTGERNFLPFLAWLRGRGQVTTFTGVGEIESVGVNTPEDLRRVEDHLGHG